MPKAPAKEEKETPEYEIGQDVQFDWDGKDCIGTITKVNAKKKELDVEGDDIPPGTVCTFDECTIVKKGKVKKEKEKEEPEEEPEKPAKTSGKGKGLSLKDKLNAKPPAESGPMGLPEGTHECLVVDGLCETNAKGTSAYLEFCIVNSEDEELNGRSGRKFYQLIDPDGEALDGVSYLKADGMLIGMMDEEFELEGDTLEEIVDEFNAVLKKLKKKEPWVSVNVVPGKGQYKNIYLQSLMEDQEDKPEKPEKN